MQILPERQPGTQICQEGGMSYIHRGRGKLTAYAIGQLTVWSHNHHPYRDNRE